MKTLLYTSFALIAFAANSVLCRLALGEEVIDAASFTAIRLLSGILVLIFILKLSQSNTPLASSGSWSAGLKLFIYAIAFSYAYLGLDTGMGALILFASVQITMILIGLLSGSRFHFVEWIGALIAFGGFVYLVLPGISAPPLFEFALMSIAGLAWGLYTLAGKGSKNPLADTASNFTRTLPLVAVLIALTFQSAELSSKGLLLAVLSGGLASGVGYSVWYLALRSLSEIQAAVLQLSVPVIAGLGGVVLASEVLSLRLVLASVLILGGVLIVIIGKRAFQAKS